MSTRATGTVIGLVAEQGFHDLILDLAFDAALHFALQVGFDLGAHLFDVAIGNAHALGEIGVDFRQLRGLESA